MLKVLCDCLEQVVWLICLKGVGVYFVIQLLGDLLDDVLVQFGLCIQYGLCVFIVKEQKLLCVVVDGFCLNLVFDILGVLIELGIGEVLVGILEEKGMLVMVQCVVVVLFYLWIGLLSDSECVELVQWLLLKGCYDQLIDCELVYEVLVNKVGVKFEVQGQVIVQQESLFGVGGMVGQIFGSLLFNLMVKSVMCQVVNQLSWELVCGLFGLLMGGKKWC